MPIAYCEECDWSRRVEDDADGELNEAMIRHYVETGHSVEQRELRESDRELES
ncbi:MULTISPECIES: hypothetical protein [Natronococcus]|uniref:hypothetical protein n=1 Tax=Natronococcus TaxID=29287 RepID=UPI001360B561|nr:MULTISPECIES: hypothetical protein [Natronococcus]NKE37569.1 hypothetical protein [Natronococcus sp. JC468]